MSLNVSIQTNLKQINRDLSKIQKKIPSITATALNKVAFQAATDAKKDMPKYIDRPTPFTVKGIRFSKANKQTLTSKVFIAPIQAEYLKLQIDGGPATPKNKSFVIPRNLKLNKFGNMPKNKLRREIANKKAFIGIPKGNNKANTAGVWRRAGGKRNPKLKMLAMFDDKTFYRRRFPFPQLVIATVDRRFNREFTKEFDKQMLKAG